MNKPVFFNIGSTEDNSILNFGDFSSLHEGLGSLDGADLKIPG